MMLLPLFGPVGPEILVILLLIVLLFGANRIPKVARATGESLGEFKRGVQESENPLETPSTDSNDTDTDSVNGDEDLVTLQSMSELSEVHQTQLNDAGITSIDELAGMTQDELVDQTELSQEDAATVLADAETLTATNTEPEP